MPMRETLKSELEQLLSAYDAKRNEAEKEARRLKEEEEVFVHHFRQVRAGLLRPCLHEFGETLRLRGHEYWVAEEDESMGRDGRPRSARIILTIHLARTDSPVRGRPAYSPAIAFAASRRRRKVCVYVRIPPTNDGSSSPRAEYTLEQLNATVVEAELVKALKIILSA
jgi:hypothetical protein